MRENRAHQIRDVTFSCPFYHHVPSSTLVIRADVWPRPTVVVDPGIYLNRDVPMTHQDLSNNVDAVVGVLELSRFGMSVRIKVSIDLLTENVEAMELMKDVESS